jgi:hypothetical protein
LEFAQGSLKRVPRVGKEPKTRSEATRLFESIRDNIKAAFSRAPVFFSQIANETLSEIPITWIAKHQIHERGRIAHGE